MNAPVAIRKANSHDVRTIFDFICDLEKTELDFDAFRSVFLHNLTDPRVHYLVAEIKQEIVGFISCHIQYLLHHAGKVGEIQELYVKPAYRSQQIGRKLVEALEEIGKREKLVNLEVTSNQDRTHTHRFYEELTFEPSHFKFVKNMQEQ
ncbi:aminoalkylphosphonate N-acetyltransferase [Nibrella viscosa]|uniref:Aminoalkylphosphonate N-acetyltransferase n=1 Tax=Nibrella viscosa TaxID=1084524 RepID=A0ABP8K6Q1_9BACT